jgi:hypothetical protein
VNTILQEVSGDQKRSLGITCNVCTYVGTLSIPEQGEWHEAFAKPVRIVSHASLLRALERRQVSVSESGVKRHRRNHA